jgi:D-alanyl-D-alanine carboxypeptidase/D-alanyl-D-alanine-endopeptidase (penicillin-binding protein 4)
MKKITVLNSRSRILALGMASLFVSGPVSAKSPSIDDYIKKPGIEDTSSFCHVPRNKDIISGQRVREKVKIASVSKLFSTYFELKTRGIDYRFITQLRYNSSNKELYIMGSKDPFMGERSLQYLVSELNRLKITEVSKVLFDENFAVYHDVEVRGKPMWSDGVMPNEVRYSGRSSERSRRDLVRFFTTWKTTYQTTRAEAEKLGVEMQKAPRFKVGQVEFLRQSEMIQRPFDRLMVYQSAKLIRYLKNLNSYSNNYVADQITAASGGIQELIRFFEKDLSFGESDFELYTGSGLWVYSPSIEAKDRVRKDNLATCEAVINVIWAIERLLKGKNLLLQDVVMVASRDPGTLGGGVYRGAPLSDAVIAKTGTLNTSAALAGELSSEQGTLFFGIFFETAGAKVNSSALNYRDKLVKDLMSEYGGKNPVEYQAHAFLPFDKESRLSEIKLDRKP